jgi:chemotaxis protein methyltransferase CheR
MMPAVSPDPVCDEVLDWFSEYSGNVIAPARRAQASADIRKLMDRSRLNDPTGLIGALSSRHDILDALTAELTVGETYFFREPQHFELIRQQILPMLQSLRSRDAPLKVWSAGCATGEEAYSLAILFEQEGQRTEILGTDISRTALAKARRASYSDWSFRGEMGEGAKPYCMARAGRSLLREELRSRVSFEFYNLAGGTAHWHGREPFGMDLILCRNVLIYFGEDGVRQAARRLYDALSPGGWLIVGPSDPPLWDHAPFEVVISPSGLCYRRAERSRAAVARLTKAPARGVQKKHTREPGKRSRPSRLVAPVSPHPVAPPPSDEARVIGLTESQLSDADACALHVRALANSDASRSAKLAEAFVALHPLSAELHYLHAVLLLGQRRHPDAVAAARRVVYLDGGSVMGHFMLAVAQQQAGEHAAARKSFQTVEALCLSLPADEIVPWSEGESARMLAAAAKKQRLSVGGNERRS